MKRATFSNRNARRVLGALFAVAALTTLACDNSMTFKAPTMSDWPEWPVPVPGNRNLEIQGVLEIQDGAVLEATVLYDGEELVGARSRCPERSGCAELELEASVLSATGNHTISFQVLRQSQEVIDYRVEGTVLVSREDVDLGGVPIRLGPRQARLEAGGAVTFDLRFIN
jgi:hypothetical protein